MDYYQKYHCTRFSYDKIRETIWKTIIQYQIQKYVPAEAKVLDLAAGYCTFINNINAKEKFAIDLNPEVLKYANKSVKTKVCSGTDMNVFKAEQFDVIFASNIFEHLTREEFEKCLKESYRILKKGGIIIVVQPNFKYAYKTYFDDYTHMQIFTDVSLCDLLKVHSFKIKLCKSKFIPFSVESKMLKTALMLHIPIKPLVWVYLKSPIKPMAAQMMIVAVKN